MLDRIVTLAPYFAALIAWRFGVPSDEESGRLLFEREIIFLAFFTIWNYLAKFALDLYRYRKIDTDPTQITIKQLRIWFLFVLLLGSMELLRLRIDREQFIFILGLILVLAAGMSGRIHGRVWLAFLATLMGQVGVAFASFLVVDSGWSWQPVLFALGVGLPSGVLILTRWWAKDPNLVPEPYRLRCIRLLTTLALSAPVMIGVLALTRQIAMTYLLVYGALFWLSRIAVEANQKEAPLKRMAVQYSRIFSALVIVLVLCRIWEGMK